MSTHEPPLSQLSDEQILELCDAQLSHKQQRQLDDLLDMNREGLINSDQVIRLSDLMMVYRRNMVRKAEAIKIAVERGLRPPLN